jgi:hypothetical protein
MAILAAKAGFPPVTQTRIVFDPSLVPQTLANDLAPGHWEEVAVAILFDDGQAFAWGAESYSAGGRRVDWSLERGDYEVSVRVASSGIQKVFRFRLDNLAIDFSRFRLEPLP